MAKGQAFSSIEMAWLIAWNVAAGYWNRVGLTPTEARELMFNFARPFQGKPVEAVTGSRVQLQQALMALRKDGFEEIQGEAPFRQHAQQNLVRLLSAYLEGGDSGMAAAWREVFPGDREVQPVSYRPIRVIENDGESEDRALEVVGAPDQATRVAAEWWYLRYRFGRNWTPGMHMSTIANESGDRFSIHNVGLPDGSHKQIFFRLPASRKETAPSSRHNAAEEPQMDIKPVGDYIAKVGKLPETG